MSIRALTAVLLLLATAPAAAQQKISHGRSIAPDGYIKIWNLAGSVRVVGWDHDSLAVTGTAERGAGKLSFHATRTAAKIGFETETEGRADLEIRVPRTSTVWVKTASADLEVRGVIGSLDLYSVSGRIRVDGSLRQLYAESMGGDLELTTSALSIRAKTGSGSILMRGTGSDVVLSTVDGSMRVTGARFERGKFETIGGDILFEGGVERGGSVSFQSHNGAVELRLPSRAPLDFLVSTYTGELRSEFGLPRPPGGRGLRGKELEFSNGIGGADVIVRTYSGAIVLRRSS